MTRLADVQCEHSQVNLFRQCCHYTCFVKSPHDGHTLPASMLSQFNQQIYMQIHPPTPMTTIQDHTKSTNNMTVQDPERKNRQGGGEVRDELGRSGEGVHVDAAFLRWTIDEKVIEAN